MIAKLTTNNFTVWVEPMDGQDMVKLINKTTQIYQKRNLENGIIRIFDNDRKEEYYKEAL
jgi:hypothetical protein